MRSLLVVLMAARALLAQETPLVRLQRESAASRKSPDDRVQPAALHQALRDWLEWRLPRNEDSTTQFSHVEAILLGELREARLTVPDGLEPWEIPSGYVQFELKLLPELPHVLFVIAGVTVPCGVDQVVYMYHYDPGGRTRVFEDHPKIPFGYTGPSIQVSDPDSQGRRLLLTDYMTIQCASTWMGMAYSVYRLSTSTAAADLVLSGQHGFWLSIDGPEFVLRPEELMLEFLDRSVDNGVHNRTEIQRYSFADGVQRLDPVAFQPQDFAEEWLTRPWSEMQSRSAAGTKPWHERLYADGVGANYDRVVECSGRPNRWLIGLYIKDKRTFFLVHDLGNYRYEMEAVSATKPSGCPGSGPASDKHPWLSDAELKALQ
jgi:hypothetical protein